MPLTPSDGVACGAAQGLWHYNRENYMFDVPLQQNSVFQLQNLKLARLAIFREDVRDMTAHTSEKLLSFLVVNTLKLGFTVTIFFNHDRTNFGNPERNVQQQQMDVIFSMSLMTSFFWLSTSIYFFMHAIIISGSLMTKVLVQLARFPPPIVAALDAHVPEANQFEREPRKLFRVPFAKKIFTTISGNNTLSDPDLEGENRTVEAHVKLFKLIRSNWSSYELYGKIAMQIGTATFLSGLAYFTLSHFRAEGHTLQIEAGGWCAFGVLSFSAWWSLLLDLVIVFCIEAVRGKFYAPLIY